MSELKYLRKLLKPNSIIARNFGYYFLGAIFLQGVGFFLVPLYTRVLTPGEYGQLELLLLFISFLGIILGLGLHNYMPIEYFHHEGEERREKITKILFIYVLLCTPVFLFALSIPNTINRYIFSSQSSPLLISLALAIAYFIFFRDQYFTLLKYQQKAAKLVTIQVGTGVLVIILNLLFVLRLKLGIEGIIDAKLIGIVLVIALVIMFENIKIKANWLRIHFKEIIGYLKISFPLAITVLAAWVLVASDRWIMNIYCTISEVGIYSLAYRFGLAYQILIAKSINAAYAPFLYSSFQKRGIIFSEKRNLKVALIYFMASSLVCTVAFFLGFPVFEVIIGRSFYASYRYILLVVFGYIFLSVSDMFIYSIYYSKKTYFVLYIFSIGALFNIATNFIMIPKYRIWGAAITTTCSYLLICILTFLFRRRILLAEYANENAMTK